MKHERNLHIVAALAAQPNAADLAAAAKAYGRWGAHRAYLVFGGSKAEAKYDAKCVEAAGGKIVKAHGCGGGLALYLGYDNFQGGVYAAKGFAIGRKLGELGIAAYVDAAGD